jgi:hypothetical protein
MGLVYQNEELLNVLAYFLFLLEGFFVAFKNAKKKAGQNNVI